MGVPLDAVKKIKVIPFVVKHWLALNPAYGDMVECSWGLSAIGFASGEPGGHLFGPVLA